MRLPLRAARTRAAAHTAVRRRVYDAINVLEAVGAIGRDGKAIAWRGLRAGPPSAIAAAAAASAGRLSGGGPPDGDDDVARAESERCGAAAAVERKARLLAELRAQQRALQALLARNVGCPAPAAAQRLQPPFLLLQARPDAACVVQIGDDMRDAQFDFGRWGCGGAAACTHTILPSPRPPPATHAH